MHLSPRSITVGIQKDTKNNRDEKSAQLLFVSLLLVIIANDYEVNFGVAFRRISKIRQESNDSPDLHKCLFRAELETTKI